MGCTNSDEAVQDDGRQLHLQNAPGLVTLPGTHPRARFSSANLALSDLVQSCAHKVRGMDSNNFATLVENPFLHAAVINEQFHDGGATAPVVCPVYRQFLNAIARNTKLCRDGEDKKKVSGFQLLQALIHSIHPSANETDNDIYRVAVHGTRTPQSVMPILRNGLDPLRRAGQAHGPGEYLGANGGRTSLGYSNATGLVLLVLVLRGEAGTAARTAFNDHSGFLVVNNPLPTANAEDQHFLLPLGFLVFSKTGAFGKVQVKNDEVVSAMLSSITQLEKGVPSGRGSTLSASNLLVARPLAMPNPLLPLSEEPSTPLRG